MLIELQVLKNLHLCTAECHQHIGGRIQFHSHFECLELAQLTSTTGEMNKTKRRGPRTEPCGTPVDDISQEEEDESILNKKMNDLLSMSESKCGQFLTNQMYV